jgi:hypothetical protein
MIAQLRTTTLAMSNDNQHGPVIARKQLRSGGPVTPA